MPRQESRSEVARLRQQIRLEYEAAQQGLTGLAEGNAQHAFITRKMENMEICYTMLKDLLGETQATRLFAETLEQADDYKEQVQKEK